tara:strand:+ start:2074 stop:2301 length:228 start_codon:yes stop_codon:yes gene_type:complete
MTEPEIMEKIVKLAADQRDDGGSGQEFVSTAMFAIGSVCAASDFPQEEVESLAMEAISQGYKIKELKTKEGKEVH